MKTERENKPKYDDKGTGRERRKKEENTNIMTDKGTGREREFKKIFKPDR